MSAPTAAIVSMQPPGQEGGLEAAEQPSGAQAKPVAKERLVGLDILRGLTMVVMVLVDYTGGSYPGIDHALWNGIHLADFVMPFFLWVSGVGMSISLRVRPGQRRWDIFTNVVKRAVRLFIVGIIVQGGWYSIYNGVPGLSLDLSSVRIFGILQRIAVAFILVAAVDLFVPEIRPSSASTSPSEGLISESPAGGYGIALFHQNAVKWGVVILFFCIGTALTYAVSPPSDWPGCATPVYKCHADKQTCFLPDEEEDQLQSMGCSGVGYLDSSILGINHVYIKGSNSAQWPPTWGFDPEGLTTTLSTVLPVMCGVHVGRVWKAAASQKNALLHWLGFGTFATVLGLLLSIWVPFNKRLWSPSYSIFMIGLATLMYAGFTLAVDATSLHSDAGRKFVSVSRIAFAPLQWLGMNAILFFVLSDCCGGLDWLLRSVCWAQPQKDNNIVAWFQNTVLMKTFNLGSSCTDKYDECGPAKMAFIWIEIVFWMVACGILYRKGIFWKI